MSLITWERTLSNRGNLTEATSSVLTITGGTNAVWGSGTSIQVSSASASTSGYLTSTDWSTFNSKQSTITGAATTITTSDLTASKALISNSSGKVAISSVTDTELGYVSGVTSAIQTQLGTKAAASTTPVISSGAGAPSSTPGKVGDIYIDTTGKRKYISTGTSSSADWLKEPVFYSGATTVIGNGGDITITLPWSWENGYLTVICSTATTEWAQEATGAGNIIEIHTSYDALTNAAYTNGGQLIDFRHAAGGTQNIFVEDSSADGLAYPKSATTTTFVLNDGGAGTTRYVKYFVWA